MVLYSFFSTLFLFYFIQYDTVLLHVDSVRMRVYSVYANVYVCTIRQKRVTIFFFFFASLYSMDVYVCCIIGILLHVYGWVSEWLKTLFACIVSLYCIFCFVYTIGSPLYSYKRIAIAAVDNYMLLLLLLLLLLTICLWPVDRVVKEKRKERRKPKKKK